VAHCPVSARTCGRLRDREPGFSSRNHAWADHPHLFFDRFLNEGARIRRHRYRFSWDERDGVFVFRKCVTRAHDFNHVGFRARAAVGSCKVYSLPDRNQAVTTQGYYWSIRYLEESS
jgi:hypothetical protein